MARTGLATTAQGVVVHRRTAARTLLVFSVAVNDDDQITKEQEISEQYNAVDVDIAKDGHAYIQVKWARFTTDGVAISKVSDDPIPQRLATAFVVSPRRASS